MDLFSGFHHKWDLLSDSIITRYAMDVIYELKLKLDNDWILPRNV